MLKKFLLTSATLLAGAGLAGAFQVSIGNTTNPHVFTDAGSTPYAAPGFISIGTFDAGALAAAGNNAVQIDAAFTQFGASTEFASAGGFGLDGFFGADIGGALNAGNPLIGQPIYLVAGDGASAADSSSLIIYMSASKVFLEDNPPASDDFKLDSGVIAGDLSLVFGTSNDTLLDIPGVGEVGATIAGRVVIPEPSSMALVGLALAGLVVRRRR